MPTKKPSRSDQISFNESGLWEKIKRMNRYIHYMRQNSKKQGYSIPEMPATDDVVPPAMRAYPRYNYELVRKAKRKPARLATIKSSSSEGRGLRRLSTKQKYKKINRTQRRKKPRKTKKMKN